MKSFKILFLPIIVIAVLFFISCEDEPYEEFIGEKIRVDSELYLSLEQLAGKSTQKDTVCVVFVYPFNVYLYDTNEEIIGSRFVENNIGFVSLLENMDSGEHVGLSYPITTVSDNGETFIIANNEELKKVIQGCIEEEIIANCNGILEKDCITSITSTSTNDRYDASIIDFYPNGEGIFYDTGTSYRMSWISLFIDGELYVNIKLEGDSEVALHWNFNWKAEIISETAIKLFNEKDSYKIEKECNYKNNCDYVEFSECNSDSSDIAEFKLNEYEDCIISLQEDFEYPETTSLSFYESRDNLWSGINPLNTESYQNKTNPQILFVSLGDSISGNIKFIQIVLESEYCEAR